MADVLSTGLSSLRALQRALDTTSHNIANVSTEGYTRQRVEFQTRQPEIVRRRLDRHAASRRSTVRRVYDQFLAQQTRSSGTNLARLDAFASQAARIDNLLGDSANGLSSSLQSFTDAINEVSTHAGFDPGAPGADRRRACAGRTAQELRRAPARHVGRGQWPARASKRRKSPRSRRESRRLNGEIAVAIQQSGQPPNDLLDQRDALIDELSGKVGVTVVAEGDADTQRIHRQWPAAGARHHGVADHHDSRSARSGTHAARRMRTRRGHRRPLARACPAARSAACSTGAARCSIRRAMSSAASASPSLRRSMRSIARAWTSRARWAATSSTSARPPRRPPRPTPAPRRSPSTRTNLGALTANDYVLTRTATGYTLRRQDTGAAVSFTGTGTVARSDSRRRPVASSWARASRPATSTSIHPTRDALAGMSVAITDPARVAAAAPIRASAASTQHRHRHR